MSHETSLSRLLLPLLGEESLATVLALLHVPAILQQPPTPQVSRALLAQALNMVLFHQCVEQVPQARAYTSDCLQRGEAIVFDHGAVRSVAWPSGTLPAGEASLGRILRPLGFIVSGLYPLPRLKMTGRAYRHQDAPQDIAQFFVSELHPESFSAPFQSAVWRVLSTSRDPLGRLDLADLEQLGRDHALPWSAAQRLLPGLVQCFSRHHDDIALADYNALLTESNEMAWIATEGNAFNHATARVLNLEHVASDQKQKGRPVKDKIEVSQTGRVRQTAFKAASVVRRFTTDIGVIEREVPGSFFEFIQRDLLPVELRNPMQPELDLAFDAGNATGIFAMTAAS
jgi:hypothetical protein